jgi:hypothetical protein
MIAHQQALGPVGEAPLKVFLCFPVLMVVPEDGFEVSGIDIHPLVDLLREVDQSRHRFHLFLRVNRKTQQWLRAVCLIGGCVSLV